MRRLALLGAVVAVVVGLSAPANAGGPKTGCPPPFEGPLTFEQIIERWPPPPDFPDPEGALAFYDQNADRKLCVMEPPHGATPAGPINVIDNRAAT